MPHCWFMTDVHGCTTALGYANSIMNNSHTLTSSISKKVRAAIQHELVFPLGPHRACEIMHRGSYNVTGQVPQSVGFWDKCSAQPRVGRFLGNPHAQVSHGNV